MTIELRFLAAIIILGLVHLVVDSHRISFQYGYRWTASSRERVMPAWRGVANRVDQAYTNFMETFPFFAAVVLTAHVADRHGTLTLWGPLSTSGDASVMCCRLGRFRPRALDGLLQHGVGRHRVFSGRPVAVENVQWAVVSTIPLLVPGSAPS